MNVVEVKITDRRVTEPVDVMERVRREQRVIEMARRAESPLEQLNRAMRLREQIEAMTRPQAAGLAAGQFFMSPAAMELQHEFLESAIRREMIRLLCR